MKRTQSAIYLPPVLPEYLKNLYDLRPITGAPSDDEVKGIHAVIRAVQNAAQIPGMFDPYLSMSLAQHLFEVQMARYRDKYPCGMFPDDMVHTPPVLPSHVAFTLEPVVGVPSDEELQAAQAAMRGYEQMAIFPSMFDPSVSMELSQHLFNIQLARYMHNAPRAELGSRPQPSGMKINPPRSAHPPPRTRQPVDTTSELSDKELPDVSNEPSAINPPTTQQSASPAQAESTVDQTSLRAIVTESNDRLTKIADVLESVKQVLVRTQQDHARGSRTYEFSSSPYTLRTFERMNDRGQLPTAQGLPLLRRDSFGTLKISELSDEHLARYLLFYDLGGDLVRLGDAPTIQGNKRDNAVTVLLDYLSSCIRPN